MYKVEVKLYIKKEMDNFMVVPTHQHNLCRDRACPSPLGFLKGKTSLRG